MALTRQRSAIRDVLRQAGRPLAPGEVHALARRRVPRLAVATVYRNLKALAEDGWLRAVELPGSPTRYELAGKGHHHHFHCRACDGVYDVSGCPPRLAELTPGGFQLEAHEIILYGRCDECSR